MCLAHRCFWPLDLAHILVMICTFSFKFVFSLQSVTQVVEPKIIMYKKCSLHWNFFKLDLSAKIWSTEPYLGSAIFYTVCSTTNRLSIMHRYVYARSLAWCNPHTIPTYRYVGMLWIRANQFQRHGFSLVLALNSHCHYGWSPEVQMFILIPALWDSNKYAPSFVDNVQKGEDFCNSKCA